MRRLWNYCRLVDNVTEYTAKAFIGLVLFIVAIFCWEVLLRSVFNLPTIWAHESTQYFFGAYFALGGAYALKSGKFVRVDILVARLKPRTKALIDSVTSILTLAFLAALTWKAIGLSIYSIKVGEGSSTAWNPPIWPIKVVVAVGSLLLGMQALTDFIRSIRLAVTGKEEP